MSEKGTLNGQKLGLNLNFSQMRLLNLMLLLVYHKCSLSSVVLLLRASERIKFRSLLVGKKTNLCSNFDPSFCYGSWFLSVFRKSFKSQMNTSAVTER